MQVVSGAVLEAQHLALRKPEEERLCRQQLEGVEQKLDLARGKVKSAEAACAEVAVRSRVELAQLQTE